MLERIKWYVMGWDFVRLLRLVLGIVIIIQAIGMREWVLGMAGLLIAGMALANIGCCGVGGCSTNFQNRRTIHENQPISYEEVDAKK